MASLKKKELRKKRLARKKAKEARVKDIKAIEAELAKSVETFEETSNPLESLENKGINERKGHCQRKGYCHRKGCGRPLHKYIPFEHQHPDQKTFQELLQQLEPLFIPGPKETFNLFPSLPQEIRIKIWRYVAGQSRRILIVRRDDYVHPDDRFRPAAMMSTCQESRAEGERHYTWELDNTVFRTLRGNKYFGLARGRL